MFKKLFGKKDYNPQESIELLEYLFFDKRGKPRKPAEIMLAASKIAARSLAYSTVFGKEEGQKFKAARNCYDQKKHTELKSMADYLKKGNVSDATKQCNKFIAKNRTFTPNDNKTIHPKAENSNCVDESKFLIQLEAYRQRKADKASGDDVDEKYNNVKKMFLPNVISNKNIDNDKITKINEKRKAKKEILQLLNSFGDYNLTDKSFDDFNTIYKKFGSYKNDHRPKEKSQFVATVMGKTKDILSKLNKELTSFIESDLKRNQIKDLTTKINNFSMIINASRNILDSSSHTLNLATDALQSAKSKLNDLRKKHVFIKNKLNYERISNSDQKIKIGTRNQKNNQPENQQNESLEEFEKRIKSLGKDELIKEITNLKDNDENKKAKMIAILKQIKEKEWKLSPIVVGSIVLQKLGITAFQLDARKQKFQQETSIEYDDIFSESSTGNFSRSQKKHTTSDSTSGQPVKRNSPFASQNKKNDENN